MSTERSIAVELVREWRWRCLEEGILVPGSDLCITNPGSGLLAPLAKNDANMVPQDDLRHTCGGRVIPVTPLRIT